MQSPMNQIGVSQNKNKEGYIVRILLMGVVFSVLSIGSVYAGNNKYETIYTGQNSRVILTRAMHQTEAQVNRYSQGLCGMNKFCVLWFYADLKEARAGADAMRSGDMFTETPGLYAIYSKNKVVNKVICYEPSSGC